jgi:hypothetical protein
MAASPTALVAEEHRQDVKLKLPAGTVRSVIDHYLSGK